LRKRQDHEALNDIHPDSRPAIEKVLETQSELDQIRTTLLTLAEIDRSAFVMRVQYDLPYAEIARVLQLSEGGVKVRVHRVRKLLFAVHSKKEKP
jgi:RNA polymerase sigma factor (sigma-70 family)